jgi:NitT/TauT family transport system substrate-binding protein
MIKELNIDAWVNDAYVKQAFKELGLDYDKQLSSMSNYGVTGKDEVCNAAVDNPREAGEVWVQGGGILPFSSPACTLMGVRKLSADNSKPNAVYLVDHALGIKVFAEAAFYAIDASPSKSPQVVPFLLKKDAEAYASKNGGKLATYPEALAAVGASR